MGYSYHDLLNFSKVVDGVDIQSQDSKRLQRSKLLGNDLSRVQDVKTKGGGLVLVNDLDVELPLGEVPRLDGIPEVLAVKVGVLARDVLSLIPDQAGLALLGLEVPLDQL